MPCQASVSSISQCPYNPNFIATGNYNGIINIWNSDIKDDCCNDVDSSTNIDTMDDKDHSEGNIEYNNNNINISSSIYEPLYSKKHSTLGWIYDIKWDPYGYGIYFSGSDGSTVSFYVCNI